VNRCASTHFGENQLAPSSIGISPLTIAHPTIFQHRWVRTFTWCYPSFILAVVRSPGFGSIRSDKIALDTQTAKLQVCALQTCFRLGFGLQSLTEPPPISRRLILPQARGQGQTSPTACQITVSCSFSLLGQGSFSPFPRGTISLSVIHEYLALRGGPRRFTRDFTCPMLLGIKDNKLS
jgi:hypothetical protein